MAKQKLGEFSTPRILPAGRAPRRWPWVLGLTALGVWTWGAYELGRGNLGLQPLFPPHTADAIADEPGYQAQSDSEDAVQVAAGNNAPSLLLDTEPARPANASPPEARDNRAQPAAAEKPAPVANDTPVAATQSPPPANAVAAAEIELADYTLSRVEGTNQYRYLFTVIKKSSSDTKVLGEIEITVAGLRNGESEELSLSKLTNGRKKAHKLGFRNFQKIEGRFELPTGFEPSEMVIAVKPSSSSYIPFTNAYDWGWIDG